MKTVNCILRAEPDRAAKDKVVDLAAWKAENLMELDEPKADHLPVSAPGRYGGRELTRRQRRAALDWAELAATLAVTAAFIVLIVRVLLF